MHSDVVIASGQSQSGVIDLSEQVITSITIPASWTAATVTFLASETSGGTFDPVYDASGAELEVTVAASRHVVIAPDATRSFRYVKLRSGNAGLAVNQSAARTLRVNVARANAS